MKKEKGREKKKNRPLLTRRMRGRRTFGARDILERISEAHIPAPSIEFCEVMSNTTTPPTLPLYKTLVEFPYLSDPDMSFVLILFLFNFYLI